MKEPDTPFGDFIHGFMHKFVRGMGANSLKQLLFQYSDEKSKTHNVGQLILRHEAAFVPYLREHTGFDGTETFKKIYDAAFYWRANANKSLHIFQLTEEARAGRVRWLERRHAEAEKASFGAALIAAAGASNVLPPPTPSRAFDMPLVYWALNYELVEEHEEELARIAYEGHEDHE